MKGSTMIHTTHSFVHRGHELVYDIYGTDGPLLVYVHGLLLDSPLWENRILGHQTRPPSVRGMLIDGSGARKDTRRIVEDLSGWRYEELWGKQRSPGSNTSRPTNITASSPGPDYPSGA